MLMKHSKPVSPVWIWIGLTDESLFDEYRANGAPSVPYYRCLYDAVGKEYHWLSRRKLPDERLAEILNDPLHELHVLHIDGSPAGFAELDRRQPDEIELVQFGVTSTSCNRR